MIRRFLKAGIRKFEEHYGYDASYLHEIIDAKTSAGFKMVMTTSFLEEDFGAPVNLVKAAKLRSTLRADCGPCLRLNITKAEEAGCSQDVIQTALGLADNSEEARIGAEFADAVLDNALDLQERGEIIRRRFGANALAALGIAVNAGQFYPVLKRAMGHAATCEPVLRDYAQRMGAGESKLMSAKDEAA